MGAVKGEEKVPETPVRVKEETSTWEFVVMGWSLSSQREEGSVDIPYSERRGTERRVEG